MSRTTSIRASDRKRPFDESEDCIPLESTASQPRPKASRVSAGGVTASLSKPYCGSSNPSALSVSCTKAQPQPLDVPSSSAFSSRSSLPSYVSTSPSSRQAPAQFVDLCDDNDDETEITKTVKLKKVTFSEIEHEVNYFKRYPVEEESPVTLATVNENEEAPAHFPSSEHSRATADFTIHSSRHGRARRELRDISKRDLQAAIKYGRKMPAHPDRHTREPRWKFIYKNLVYITDSTCKREITSYKEAITIHLQPVSIPMMEHHTEVKRILREESHLCTGHTFIVIDQSGSMRNSDVNGFVSRSHAAYGTLALDFISEQLNIRPNKEDLFAESVTVVEMRDAGEIVFSREPFDWILFNRLVKRPNVSRPSFNGNYNDSLSLVQKMILEEHSNLLDDGVEDKEMPNFSVVFLSDGRPSDCNKEFARKRIEILKSLTETLKSKFYLCAMGIGANGADFGALASMVKIVKDNGGEGQFVHAGLSAVALSSTFSDISNTLTSHRTTLLSSSRDLKNGMQAANAGSKLRKDFTMRETGKIVGKKMPVSTYIDGKGYTIKRFRFDKDLFNRNNEDPWKDVDFANHGAVGFEVEECPFGKGSERLAYRFHELKRDKKSNSYKKAGKMMVAKSSIHIEKETKEAFHQNFCRVQSMAQEQAINFNSAVRQVDSLQAVVAGTRPPELQFILCHVYTYKNNVTNEEKALLVEKKLPGKFTKYNSNNGYVKDAVEGMHNTRAIELKSGKVQFEEFVQAFSHWVYVHNNKNLIVCDIQGVLNEEGRYPIFQLTDPAICTRKGKRYGNTDMRLNGIRNFCKTHRCGLVCKGLGLQCFVSSSNDSVRRGR